MEGGEQQWYYTVNEEKRGPISLIALQAEVRNGQVPKTSMVWTASFGEEWKPLAQVPLLSEGQQETVELAELPEFESAWSDPKFVKKVVSIGVAAIAIALFCYMKFTKSAAAEAYLVFDDDCFYHRYEEASACIASDVDAFEKQQILKDIARNNIPGIWQNPWVFKYAVESDKRDGKNGRDLVITRVVKGITGAAARTRVDTLTITMVKEGDEWKVSSLSKESMDPLRDSK